MNSVSKLCTAWVLKHGSGPAPRTVITLLPLSAAVLSVWDTVVTRRLTAVSAAISASSSRPPPGKTWRMSWSPDARTGLTAVRLGGKVSESATRVTRPLAASTSRFVVTAASLTDVE